MDDLVTTRDAALIKGVDQSSVRRAIREGRLAGVKRGRDYLVRRSALDRWEPSRRAGSRDPIPA